VPIATDGAIRVHDEEHVEMGSKNNAIAFALAGSESEQTEPVSGLLRDPLLDALVAALCRASVEFLKTEEGVFAIAATIREQGEIQAFHVSRMDGREWLEMQTAVGKGLEIGLRDGLFVAGGHCMNLGPAQAHRSERVPALAIRIDQDARAPIHVLLPYERLSTGDVRFGPPRISPTTAARDADQDG
jgi:hypothetical protein